MGKGCVSQAWGPDFNPSGTCEDSEWRPACLENYSSGEKETDRSLRITDWPDCELISRTVRDHVSKIKVHRAWGMRPHFIFWPQHSPTSMCSYTLDMITHTNTQKEKDPVLSQSSRKVYRRSWSWVLRGFFVCLVLLFKDNRHHVSSQGSIDLLWSRMMLNVWSSCLYYSGAVI